MFFTRKHLIVYSAFVTSLISMVWSYCPDQCYCLPREQDIYCENKNLQEFPKTLQENVEYLSVANNQITTIPVLSKYSMIRMLNASGNRIMFLEQNVFLGLGVLNHLDLSSNNIASLQSIDATTLFETNENLETLILSNNKISQFDELHDQAVVSNSLKVLDLSSNNIQKLEGNVLTYLPSLTHLHLARNPLHWVMNLQSVSLSYLDVSFGQIDSMNRDQLEGLPNLQTLNISGNTGFYIFSDLISRSVQVYEAQNCQLTKPSLNEFQNLEHANLRGNKIEVLKAKGFIKNYKLVHLDLSSNAIHRIEQDTFLGLANIRHISLAENEISGIMWDMFITNLELETLNLSKNPINSLPKNLTLLKLKELDLSMCQIHPLNSVTFSRLPLLQILNLSQNGIEEIPDNLISNSLKELDLSRNRLKTITNDTFSKIPSIEILNLIGNRFTITPKKYMFSSNTLLKSIELSDNLWICECKDQEFKELWEYLVDSTNPKLIQSERYELKCTLPENLKGERWDDACSLDFWPVVNRSTFFDRYGVYILMMVMTITFALVVIVSIRERMKKREKVLRGRLDARRRTIAENHERVVRLYRESVERINDVHRRQEESSFQQIAERQPPSYEEAVLMPRREESASRDELRASRRANRGLESSSDRDVDNSPADRENTSSTHLTRAQVEQNTADYDEISIYSEVAEGEDDDEDGDGDEDEDEDYDEDEEDDGEESPRGQFRMTVRPASEGGRSVPGNESGNANERVDEAKLMRQLRIEVWSREDIRATNDSNNDLNT